MAMTPNFGKKNIEDYIDKQTEKIHAALLYNLQIVGEKFITNARESGTYKDRTGNLRSSIGYAIYKDGVRTDKSFVSKTVGGVSAEVVAAFVATQFPTGFVLIVVAGMNYAAAVESRNFDVLTASSLIANDDLTKVITDLNDLIKQM